MAFSLGIGANKSRGSSSTDYTQSGSSDTSTDVSQNSTSAQSQVGANSSIAQSLGFSNQASTTAGVQNSASSQAETGATNIATQTQNLLQTLQNALSQSAQQSSGNTTQTQQGSAFAAQDIEALRTVLPAIFGQSLQNFTTASGGALPAQIASIQRQLSESVLPGFTAQEASSGSYNSTSKSLLANDAIARGAELAAMSQVTAAKEAGTAVAPLLQLGELLKGAFTSQQGNTAVQEAITGTQNTATTGTQQSTGSQNTTQLVQNLLNALTSSASLQNTNTATQTAESQAQQQNSVQNTVGVQQQNTSTDTTQTAEESGSSDTKTKGKVLGAAAGFGS